MTLNSVEIEDTFAEAFPMTGCRVIITAETPEWALTGGRIASGYAPAVVACDGKAKTDISMATTRWS